MRRLRLTQPRLTALHLLEPERFVKERPWTEEEFGAWALTRRRRGKSYAATIDVASELKARCSPNNLRKLALETIPPWLWKRGDAQ